MLFTILALQTARQQVAPTHDVCLAMPASQELRGPGHQVQRAPPPLPHHSQVCHTQAHSAAGLPQPAQGPRGGGAGRRAPGPRHPHPSHARQNGGRKRECNGRWLVCDGIW